MIKIDDDIPIPEFRSGWKWPLTEMGIGQSFLIPPEGVSSVRAIIARVWKPRGRMYVTRKVEGGVRVWRVE